MSRHEEALKILNSGTVIPATPLALTPERRFDEQRQRVLMRYYLDAGAGGIATAVHTTQFAIRDKDVGLYEPVLRLVAGEIDRFEDICGKAVVRVAGVCGPTEQALREADLAQRLGYDAVLLSPGGLQALTEDELLERTRRVAEIIPVIGFYLQTGVGGRSFSYGYWESVCATNNVVAIKCAPFNRYLSVDVVRAAAMSPRADQIALYTGNDDNIILDLLTTYRFTENGAIRRKQFVGGLLGHWSVWTHRVVQLFDKVKQAASLDSVPAELLTLAQEVTDANAAIFDSRNGFRGCIAGIHEVLRRQGLLQGIWCLDPNETLSEGQMDEIVRVYRLYPHLNDDDYVRDHLQKWLAPDKLS